MSKPFDVTLKELMERYPADWARLAGVADAETAEAVDADLSTVSAEADKVFLVGREARRVLHVEPQSSYETVYPQRLHRYNAMLDYRHGTPVQSVALLLRPEADGPHITGTYRRELPDEGEYLLFRYRVIRVWQLPPELLLNCGLGILPLAPLGNVPKTQVPEVVREMKRRISAEAEPPLAATLWASTYVLMGLRYSAEFAEMVLRGVRDMKESTTYQAILAEGREEGREEGRADAAAQFREVLIDIGTRRLGAPTPETQAAIAAVMDVEELAHLTRQTMDVESWDELLRGH